MASQLEVAQIVAMIGAAYPSFDPSKDTVRVYFELLQDMPVDLIRAATLQCCSESGRKFAPSVGEIRGTAGEITRRSQGVPSAIEAWNEVCNAPKSGEHRRVTDEYDENGAVIVELTKYQWSHPLVEYVVTMLGWPDFPDWEKENFERAHFLKYYDAELQKHTNQSVELPEVTAYIEKRRNGKPLLMGEQVRRLAEGMKK